MKTRSIKQYRAPRIGSNVRDQQTGAPEGMRLALSVADAAAATGLSQSYLRDEIARGRLPAVRKGRRLLVRVPDLDAYLKS